jgi:hypothetical protein
VILKEYIDFIDKILIDKKKLKTQNEELQMKCQHLEEEHMEMLSIIEENNSLKFERKQVKNHFRDMTY